MKKSKLFLVIFAVYFVLMFIYLTGIGMGLGLPVVNATPDVINEVIKVSIFASIMTFGLILLGQKCWKLIKR